MAIQFGIIGAFTIDNVINAEGDVGVFKCGGNAYYAAAGARLWAEEVGVVARVGEDFPRRWIEKLADAGVDVSGVRHVAGPHLLQSGLKYNAHGDRMEISSQQFFEEAGTNAPEEWAFEFPRSSPDGTHQGQIKLAPDPEDIPGPYLRAAAFHLAPRYYSKHQACLSRVKAHDILTVLDPGIWYMRNRNSQQLHSLFSMVDILIPSEIEVRAFFGEAGELEDLAVELARYGPKVVVTKVGRQGCIVYDGRRDALYRLPVYPAQVVDPTGAGDSFCGGFMVGYMETQDPVAAAAYGTVSASFVVEGFGADYTLQFTTQQARARLEAFSRFANIKV